MRKTTKPAADSASAFTQWLWSAPANVGANDAITLKCNVELFTTGWIALRKIAHRKGWTLEETVSELMQHCVEEFEGNEKLFMWRLLGEEEDRPAHVPYIPRPVQTERN